MPIYEYRCQSCGEVTEVIQRFGDRPLRKCRSCSGRLEKLVSRTAFLLKGGGWYAEGYTKSGTSKKQSKKVGSGADKTEAKSSDAASKPAESKPKKSKD